MTRDEAERRARQLQAEHPEHATHHFFAREAADGSWQVARVPIPERLQHGPLTETVEAAPRPPQPDDPRSGHEQRVPGFPGGLG